MPVLVPFLPSPQTRGPWKHCWTNLLISFNVAVKLLDIPDPAVVLGVETLKFRVCWYPQRNLFKVQNSWDSDPRSPVLSLEICFLMSPGKYFSSNFFLTSNKYILRCNPGCVPETEISRKYISPYYFLFCSIPFFPNSAAQTKLISWLTSES